MAFATAFPEDSVLWLIRKEACVSSPSSVWDARVNPHAVCPFTCQRTFGCFCSWPLEQCCCGHVPGAVRACLRVSVSLPGTGLRGPVVILCLTVGGPATVLSHCPSRVPPALREGSSSPHPTSVCYIHPCPGHPGGCEEPHRDSERGVAYPYSHPGDLYGFRPLREYPSQASR